jgi:hypothetical protein
LALNLLDSSIDVQKDESVEWTLNSYLYLHGKASEKFLWYDLMFVEFHLASDSASNV